jgi:carbon monoxide dehydrogenase subunit G
MAKITGQILIGRPAAEVFDFVADSRNEPSFNPAMAGVELLTALPIGQGTRFRARMGRAGTQMLVELTEFDRPHRLGSRTTSSMMQTSGTLTFAADGDGTVMNWDWQVHPKGWMRMLGPLFEPLGNRMERRIWTSMKRYLENTGLRPYSGRRDQLRSYPGRKPLVSSYGAALC